MDPRIKVGLVGTGHMGQYHVNVAVGLNDYDVLGIYDADGARCTEIAERFGVRPYTEYSQMLDEVDAVVVAVPTVHHHKIALEAVQAGRHVLVEKPMTETVAQARELVELADSKNLIFQVGHVERFNGAVLELGKMVDQPILIESRRLAPFSPRINDVGVVLDLMIHDIDIVLNLVNDNVSSVHARGVSVFSPREDVAVATLQFESGTVANLVASRATQAKVRRLNITQPNAFIVLDFATQDIDVHRRASSAYLMTREELKYKQEAFVEKIAVHRDNPLRQEHQHFIACIRGSQEPIVGGQEELRTLEIANEILGQIESTMAKIDAGVTA
ncbi:MAG: Gfo/Idh/MocA family oxidoreductase [Spirochaetales bacterium]|nr:Gfo/Idh/MocA family oxidoreductase [Leptospiraceae bacterium]MCP5483678.1 Gfo/Idh/MocA family oxidoreductase [Spirochaetales bacterium]